MKDLVYSCTDMKLARGIFLLILLNAAIAQNSQTIPQQQPTSQTPPSAGTHSRSAQGPAASHGTSDEWKYCKRVGKTCKALPGHENDQCPDLCLEYDFSQAEQEGSDVGRNADTKAKPRRPTPDECRGEAAGLYDQYNKQDQISKASSGANYVAAEDKKAGIRRQLADLAERCGGWGALGTPTATGTNSSSSGGTANTFL